MTDAALREFVETRSPAAFRALVERHSAAVYGQCLRQLHDAHLAEDVTQAVFVVLFRKAASLPRDVVLPAWLFQVTRYACANARRGELADDDTNTRPHSCATIQTTLPIPRAGASEPQLFLDDALARLGRADREAIVLRYYSGLDCGAVAAGLGISVEAARRRSFALAVAKLREILVRRGVVLPSVMLLQQLDRIGAVTAPAGLASRVASNVIGAGELAPWCDAVAKGATRMLRVVQLKLAAVVGSAWIAVSVVGLTLGAAMLRGSGDTPSHAAAAPVDQGRQSIRANLEALARAMRAHDAEALRQLTFVAPDAQGALAHAMLAENVAYRRLQDAWASKLKGPLELHGVGFVWFSEPDLDGGLEILIERTLAALDDAQVQLTDQAAHLPIAIGQQGVRSSAEAWGGAWLWLVNDGGAWKLDLARTIHVGCRMTFQPGRRPATAEDELQVAVSFKNQLAEAIDGVAAEIEEGKITRAGDAGQRVEADVAGVFSKFGLAGINYSINPAQPTSSEAAR